MFFVYIVGTNLNIVFSFSRQCKTL